MVTLNEPPDRQLRFTIHDLLVTTATAAFVCAVIALVVTLKAYDQYPDGQTAGLMLFGVPGLSGGAIGANAWCCRRKPREDLVKFCLAGAVIPIMGIGMIGVLQGL